MDDETLLNRARELVEGNNPAAAVRMLRERLLRGPGRPNLLNALGLSLSAAHDPDGALEVFARVRAELPESAGVRCNIAQALRQGGRTEEAIGEFRAALERRPDDAKIWQELILTLEQAGGMVSPPARVSSAAEIDAIGVEGMRRMRDETTAWARRHSPARKSTAEYPNDRDESRPLRVGYVSADFYSHPVGRFVRPLIESHRRQEVSAICYSCGSRQDDITAKLRESAQAWRDVKDLSDDALIAQIQQDRIDILVDLGMHTPGSRVAIFGAGAAPVQVSYLAYVGTTGMDAIGYRLTDVCLDPPGLNDEFHVERPAYLNRTYWCYRPLSEAGAVAELPARRRGSVTFGCLNNFSKVSDACLRLFGQVLSRVSGSRLLIHARGEFARQRIRRVIGEFGVAADRIEFHTDGSLGEYFDVYSRIDVMLDSLPCNGATTTCDALWMGVPVVSLVGRKGSSRAGLSVMSAAGLAEWACPSPEGFVECAVGLASDLETLGRLRMTLRERLAGSALMDAASYAADVERAYRELWFAWCQGNK